MLEEMAQFFDNRLDGYDEHQLNCIHFAREFYPHTARCLPLGQGVSVLDLGCGTGLELEEYFRLNPTAKVTGIDLAPGMLAELKRKLADYDVNVILGSYFEVPFGNGLYDAAVSVESLHHFTREEKFPLYWKLHQALKDGGYFILTDYFSLSDKEENFHQAELLRLKRLQGLTDGGFYHYDTPLTVKHEMEVLSAAGFSAVEITDSWGVTHTIKATK